MTRKNKRLIVIAAAVVLGLGSAVAYATIPDSQGVIHACYKAQNGQLRVTDSGTCDSSETSLTWNQTGPQGPAGPQGSVGPKGDQGPPGPATGPETWFRTGVVSTPDGNINVDGIPFTVVSRFLPADHWMVLASVSPALLGDDGDGTCQLRINEIVLDSQDFDFEEGGIRHASATLMMQLSLEGTGHVDVTCSLSRDHPEIFVAAEVKARLLATKITLPS